MKKAISFGSIISGIRAPFDKYYATLAEKEQHIRGLLPENWMDPDFDIEEKLKNVKGLLIEKAGPTESGYSMVDTQGLGKKIYTSNIYEGCPILEDGKTVNFFGKVDFQADAKKLPFRNGTIGAVFCSCLGKVCTDDEDFFRNRMKNVILREEAIKEALRVLEPGGLLILQDFWMEDMKMAEHLGFKIKQKAVDASFPKHVRCSFIAEKPILSGDENGDKFRPPVARGIEKHIFEA